ncbi:pollen-specific leucine-rich repeat extensin-like protein 1 [Lactuca sativa]|uniref:pollen-specific leucine-rich repeat extensin-like protein 1 n=1 Tax=Lactuca sativa TaxID=4236 RepID=UPI000CD870ED|nr:pollen-specific leucine-rich repeat extensin-like protein 1 [Lactuca sativa]
MADAMLSSIATFHMTKIIVSDPTKFMFNGSIPETINQLRGGRSRNQRKQRTKVHHLMLRQPKSEKADKAVPSSPKKKKVKKMARKPKESSLANSDEEQEVHVEGLQRGNTPPRSPTPEVQPHVSIPTPPPSRNPTTTLISVAPIPLLVSSQPTTIAPLPPPIFSQTTTTNTTEPPVHVSVSNTGAPTGDTETPVTTKPSFTISFYRFKTYY